MDMAELPPTVSWAGFFGRAVRLREGCPRQQAERILTLAKAKRDKPRANAMEECRRATNEAVEVDRYESDKGVCRFCFRFLALLGGKARQGRRSQSSNGQVMRIKHDSYISWLSTSYIQYLCM